MKRWAIFLAVFLFGFQVLSPVLASELTDDYFDIATNYFNSNNIDKSLEYLDLIIQLEPDYLAAQTLRNKISPPQPAIVPQVIVPQTVVPLVIASPAIVSAADIATANILAAAPNPENLVIIEAPKEKVQKAIPESDNCYVKPRKLLDLKREVWFNKKDYLAYFHLGEYYQYHGRFNEAIASYKKVVKLNSKYPHVYMNLAESFFETKEFNYCLIALSQYKEFCPDADSEFIQYLTTRVYSSSSPKDTANLDLVINSLNDAISKFPEAKVFYLAKIKIYEVIGDNLNYNKTMDLMNERFNK